MERERERKMGVKVEVKGVDQVEIVDKVECAFYTSTTHNLLRITFHGFLDMNNCSIKMI